MDATNGDVPNRIGIDTAKGNFSDASVDGDGYGGDDDDGIEALAHKIEALARQTSDGLSSMFHQLELGEASPGDMSQSSEKSSEPGDEYRDCSSLDDSDDGWEEGENEHNLGPSTNTADGYPSFLSSAIEEDGEDKDIETLACNSCALASIPVPDYTEAFSRADDYGVNRWLDKNTYTTQRYHDEVMSEAAMDTDPNSVLLAKKTSHILSGFQDYVEGIGGKVPGNAGREILEGGVSSGKGFMAGIIRNDNKSRVLEPCVSSSSPRRNMQLLREWNFPHEGYVSKSTIRLNVDANNDGQVQHMHDLGLEGFGEEDDPQANMVMVQRGQNYTHPLLQSKKVKFALISCVLAMAIVLGVSLGVSNRNHEADKKLSDETAKVEKEMVQDTNNQEEKTGSEAGNNVKMVIKNGVYSTQEDPVLTQEEIKVYQSAVTHYLPREFNRQEGWIGKTYMDAYRFCGQKNAIICPYDAICPLGPDTKPLGGYKERIEGSWVPITDKADDWVQLSRQNACIKYSYENFDSPEWSIDGGEDVDEVAHVMCCTPSHDETIGRSGGIPMSKENADGTALAYKIAAETFMPLGYYREEGWTGQTFADAVQFCRQRDGRDICPYDAICPMGPGTMPLGGYKEEEDGSRGLWVPVVLNGDGRNDWVQVSTANPCALYSMGHADSLEWGISGGNDEELSQTMMCCKESILSTGEEKKNYQTTAEKYRPIWYNRANGWFGQTYDEAVSFCQSIPHHEKKRVLCPYEAYCPMGDIDTPLGDVTEDEPNGSWVAISDASNGWISVGPEDTCKPYDAVNGEPPQWGTTGIGNEDITRHVMCCDAVEDDDVGNVGSEDVDPTTTIQGSGVEWAFMAYDAAANKYEPKSYGRSQGWLGKTYYEAFRFCRGNGGRTLCPYDAICPAGPDSEPLDGFKEESSESWIPISNRANDWVRVSKENACIAYSSLHSEEPGWGMTGEGNEEITRHIMCCLKIWHGDGGTTKADGQVQSQASVQEQEFSQMGADDEAIDEVDHLALLQPTLHNRDDGWEGNTYLEAIQFCAREEGYSLCSYHAICPFGPNSKPFVGYKESSDGGPSLVPTSDGGNSWVNLSRGNSCIRYNVVHSNQPDGNTAKGSEDSLENVMCCKGSIAGTAEESFLYENVGKTYQPRWYGRDKGWTGRTYDEAVDFCTNTKHKKMCPYEAYCPIGKFGIALGGVKEDEPNGSWAPLGDAFNSWVSVGPENTCHVYDILNGGSPGWGITGIGNEEITRHIMCCEHVGDDGIDDGSQQQVVVTVTSQPSKDPKSSSKAVTAREGFNSTIKYNPVWYDRSSGWVGQTYDAAYTFCSRRGPGNDVCPYAVICPGGSMKTPYGGTKDGPNGVWAPVNDAYNEWVQVSDIQVCVHYKDLNPRNHPVWGLTGDGNEEITRHIACCDMNYVMGEASVQPEIADHLDSQGVNNKEHMDSQGVNNKEHMDSQGVNDKYEPKWYTRGDGWVGNTYVESIGFCSQQDSAIPCPYEAYCPDGSGSEPIGGSRQEREVWAPIMDSPNGWVNVGSSSDSCELYNSLHSAPPLWGLFDQHSDVETESGVKIKDMTAHIMCCREPPPGDKTTALQSAMSARVPIANTIYEQDILDKEHPIWFSRKHGYHGNTYDDAADFCKSIGDMVLCAAETYCPEGNTDLEKPLFLKRNAFEGEQWAPVATTDGNAQDKWILVGTLDGQSQSTCARFSDVKEMKPKGWNVDDGDSDLKENVLCCLNPNHLVKEMNFAKHLDKTWLGESFGWKGGSHNDATEFCQKLGNKKLCPYTAYCPHGAGRPVIGGHVEDFNMIGEQWAPVYQGSSVHHEPNLWVMIGQKYQNSATTCMNSWQLEGHEPVWGMSNENADMKHHIMCCSLGY